MRKKIINLLKPISLSFILGVISFQCFVIKDAKAQSVKTYTSVMHEYNKGNDVGIENFIIEEIKRLEALGVSKAKQEVYKKFLEARKNELLEKEKNEKDQTKVFVTKNAESKKIEIPKNIPGFYSEGKEIIEIDKIKLKIKNKNTLLSKLSNLVLTQSVTELSPPTLSDITDNTGIIQIDGEIKNLARTLNYNPRNIYNYLRNNIKYQPYAGIKKGAKGCLESLRCNDLDSTALGISLLRASGIPARYKKVAAEMSKQQFINFLGTVDLNTAMYLIYKANIFVGSADPNLPSEGTLLTNDFSQVETVIMEIFYPQAYIEYDQHGGNYSNALYIDRVLSTLNITELRNILSERPKHQWVPFEFLLARNYQKTNNPILPSSFDTQGFWENQIFADTQNSPMTDFATAVQNATGYNINDSNNFSYNEFIAEDQPYIPITTRFKEVSVSLDGQTHDTTYYSTLPEEFINKITFQIKDTDTENILFEYTFDGYEIDNKYIYLDYQGATQEDKNIIESYGGIAHTPASLVDIVAKLIIQNEGLEFIGNTNIKIGQSLILETIYDRIGDDPWIADKFSTAGNNEGIYTILESVNYNNIYDNDVDELQNSKILLEGNAEIARQYLRRYQAQYEQLAKVFNMNKTINFAQAVVTQNRILNISGEFPTTFDFSGLSINAHALIHTIHTNKTKDYRTEFNLISGLEASYQEGQIFNDIAGLNGIATVQGLQYAANTSGYTVHTISTTNESVIDGLNVSANTKTRMHEAVQEGRTVYTPNKMVEDGQWRGILYIAIDPNIGDGTYAIGEQVQNGGWTKDEFEQVVLENISTNYRYSYGHHIYSYTDSNTGINKSCSITTTDANAIMSYSGYDQNLYGLPCMKEQRQYGTTDHEYIVTTDGAHFKSNARGYNYWTKESDANTKVEQADISLAMEWFTKPMKFNTTAGTYSRFGLYNMNSPFTAYYQPTSNGQGEVREVYGRILNTYSAPHYNSGLYWCNPDSGSCIPGKDQAVSVLGYPTTARNTAAQYNATYLSTTGEYQDFAGGRIYYSQGFDTLFNPSSYVVDRISSFVDSTGGTAEYGFPRSNPHYNQSTQTLEQEFQSGYIFGLSGDIATILSGNGVIGITKSENLKNDEAFQEGFYDSFAEAGITGVIIDVAAGVTLEKTFKAVTYAAANSNSKIIRAMSKKLAGKTAAKFLPVAGWVLGAYSVANTAIEVSPLVTRCNSDDAIVDGARPSYWCGKALGHGTLIASGAVGSLATTSVGNMYAASTGAGRVGKYKLFGVGDDSVNWGINTKKIAGHKKRDHVYRMAKELNENELKLVAKDKDLINGILENPYSLTDNEIVLLARHKITGVGMKPGQVRMLSVDNQSRTTWLEESQWQHVKKRHGQDVIFDPNNPNGKFLEDDKIEDLIDEAIRKATPYEQNGDLIYEFDFGRPIGVQTDFVTPTSEVRVITSNVGYIKSGYPNDQ